MTRSIRYSPTAIDDLDTLRLWIEAQADFETAAGYLDRIRHRIDALKSFPHRGRARDDLKPGVRTLSFEGRILIAYVVTERLVEILRVVSTARKQDGLFRE